MKNDMKALGLHPERAVFRDMWTCGGASFREERLKVMPDEASVRQDSLRQDSLRQRVAYRAPGFERSCAQNGRKTH